MELFDSQSSIPAVGPQTQNEIVGLTSADRGETWSPPETIAMIPRESDPQEPDTGEGIEPGTFTLTGGPDGTFWLVLRPLLAGDGHRILLARSTPGGWSEPREIVQRKSPAQMLLSSVAALTERVLAVSFYDTQRDVACDDRFDADVRMVVSADRGETFHEIHLAGPIDLRKAYVDGRYVEPGSGVRALGDYVGLAAGGGQFVAALPLTPPLAQVGQSQLFVAQVDAQGGKRPRIGKRPKTRSRRKSSPAKCRRNASQRRTRRCRRSSGRRTTAASAAVTGGRMRLE